MDYTHYALKYCPVSSEEDIAFFRYGCYIGIEAIKALFEHRNRQFCPRVIPCITKRSSGNSTRSNSPNDILVNISNHNYDGEYIEDLVKRSVNSLSDQKALYDEIISLSHKKRCLDKEEEYTLPRYIETEVTISDSELSKIFCNIRHFGGALKRIDIEQAIPNNSCYNVDEVISGLVKYSLI